MAKVTGKKELCRIEDINKNFKAIQGIGGTTLFDRYNLAETNIIYKSIDVKYQGLLAYPVQKGNTITFYGKKYNETPQLFAELQGEELEKYTSIKNETLSHYTSKINSLQNSGKIDEAEFLSRSIKFVDERFIYCYDDIVVLGVWGMQVRDNVRGDINEICKNFVVKEKHPLTTTVIENDFSKDESEPIQPTPEQESIVIQPKQENHIIVPPPPLSPKLPWYKRFWNWLRTLFTGKGCFKYLLWLLLILLLFFLLCWLFRNCDGRSLKGGAILGDNDSGWFREDPNVGNDGGVYDPYNPYQPVPTPPGYEDILPPQQGVLPPIGGDPQIIPGNPSIIANRLNILMENKDKSILDLANEFKTVYPTDDYQVVYYDDVIKRMQIEIPKEERDELKLIIPEQFAPDYELFVFDEALFEGVYSPNDPAFKDSDKSWFLEAINAPQAWDITQGSEKVTIAIVDNGFNLKHPELKSKVVQPYNVWLHSDEVFPQIVDHGTHVAGTALAIADNKKGICGIAPNCKFMPIQVANKDGIMTTTSVLDGILYALYQGADVINVSLGSQFSGLSHLPESAQQDLILNHFKEEERLWREIMRIAAKHNSTIVVAAGNDNVLAGIDALQRPELFITVSAVDKNNQNINKAEFSNYGDFSTISAPGVGIYSSVGKNDYQIMDGTSMAAPIVSGAVALMKSINDTITTKQIICILQETGVNSNGDIGKLIQIDKALNVVKSGKTVDCTPSPTTGDVQILLSWNNYNDLDLLCTDPNGESVFFKNPKVSSGGQLEIDMNVEYPDSKTPIENIYWEPGKAPNGMYNVYLLYYGRHEPLIDETTYNIEVMYGGKTESYSGVIKKHDNAIHICSFTLGTVVNNPHNPITQPPIALPENNRRKQLEEERNRLQQELDRIDDELRRIGNSR